LRSALYNPNLAGSTQPIRRPDYKVAIRTGEQNAVVVLDVYQGKDFVEIVGWRMVNEKGLAKMQRYKQIIELQDDIPLEYPQSFQHQ